MTSICWLGVIAGFILDLNVPGSGKSPSSVGALDHLNPRGRMARKCESPKHFISDRPIVPPALAQANPQIECHLNWIVYGKSSFESGTTLRRRESNYYIRVTDREADQFLDVDSLQPEYPCIYRKRSGTHECLPGPQGARRMAGQGFSWRTSISPADTAIAKNPAIEVHNPANEHHTVSEHQHTKNQSVDRLAGMKFHDAIDGEKSAYNDTNQEQPKSAVND